MNKEKFKIRDILLYASIFLFWIISPGIYLYFRDGFVSKASKPDILVVCILIVGALFHSGILTIKNDENSNSFLKSYFNTLLFFVGIILFSVFFGVTVQFLFI
ncbi:MAG: hypothetical protein RBR08_16355 [Desulforegulaceae bacterium]|nr:hypothetical protein [Desulforegulaceae bacterium]